MDSPVGLWAGSLWWRRAMRMEDSGSSLDELSRPAKSKLRIVCRD